MGLLVAWLIASAAGSAAARGLFEHGTAPFWGALLVVAQGLVLRRRAVPFLRWVAWGAGGWVVGAMLAARLISALVRHVVVTPPGLAETVAVFAILGGAEFVVLRSYLPNALVWVALNVLAGVALTLAESPIRVALFTPVETALGVAPAEAVVGAALGAVYGAITAPQVARIRPGLRAGSRN